MASSSVTGTPSRVAHIQETNVHMDMKIELSSHILVQISLKNPRDVFLILAISFSSQLLIVSSLLWLCQDCVASMHPY